MTETLQEAVVASEAKPDQATSIKTIYNVSTLEILWRNFLAGSARAFGGLIIYLVFIVIIGNLFLTFIYPQLKPLIEEYRSVLKNFGQLNSDPLNSGGNSLPNLDDEQLQQILQSPELLKQLNRP